MDCFVIRVLGFWNSGNGIWMFCVGVCEVGIRLGSSVRRWRLSKDFGEIRV